MKIIPISGVIGLDATAKDVRNALDAAAGQAVEVQISSPGGIIFDGLEIYNLIRHYPGSKSTRLMGMAASMASYVALAGDRVIAEENVVFMIHGAQGLAIGDRLDMRKMAEILDGFSWILGKAYAEKAGVSEAQILELMDQETWYFGEEAKEAGFVDEIVSATTGISTNKAAALASARAAVAMASARARPLWPADAAERAVALLGNARPAQERPARGLMDQITAMGWTAEDVAAALKAGETLGDVYRRGPKGQGLTEGRRRYLTPGMVQVLRTLGSTKNDLDKIEADIAAEVAAAGSR